MNICPTFDKAYCCFEGIQSESVVRVVGKVGHKYVDGIKHQLIK